jgi:hypothetical protein
VGHVKPSVAASDRELSSGVVGYLFPYVVRLVTVVGPSKAETSGAAFRVFLGQSKGSWDARSTLFALDMGLAHAGPTLVT